MPAITVSAIEDGLFVAEFQTPEARINQELIADFHKVIDTVEAHDGPTALILTNKGKFFSNGLQFEALADDPMGLLTSFHRLMARLVSLGVPTIAALNGHTFAGGAMMAFCCDYRIMNKDKGFISVNEVDIHLPLPPAMARMVTMKVNRSQWSRMILNAHRYSGTEAERCELVNVAVPETEVRPAAVKLAKSLLHRGENKSNYSNLKKELFKDALRDLLGDDFGFANNFPSPKL